VLSVLSAEAARGLSFVGLDFFQLIRADTARIDEVEHWFTTSNALAAAAKRLNLVILASVQPTQSATKEQERNRRFLTKGDLRGGSAIAQAAYGVLLFNRVYDEDGELDRRYLDVDISKWKNADTGTVRVKVDRAKDLIVD
jgi:replicative DNA helicase